MAKDQYKTIKKCELTIGEKWCDGYLVSYPVSYRYNGGIVVDGEWYEGFNVAKPKAPKGFKLTSIACGLQLNARPPYATVMIDRIDGSKVSKKELKAILSK